jgi:hypothetical protein
MMKEETSMSPKEAPARGHGVTRAVLLALWIVAATGSPLAPDLLGGLLFVPLGVLVLAFQPPAGTIRSTLGSRARWETASRASWTTGAIAAIVLFVRAIGLSDGEIERIATGMALAFVPGIAGLALAGLAMALAFRLAPVHASPGTTPRPWVEWLGRLLFLWLVACAALLPWLGEREWQFAPWNLLLSRPALLILAGATLALVLLFGRAWRRLAPVALALSGTLGALVGLAQALLGMARVSIAQVTAGMESITTSCFVALVALALLSSPPRETRDDGSTGARTATNVAYALLPLACLLLHAIVFVMVITPMRKPL